VDRIIKCIRDVLPPALISCINSALVDGFIPQNFPELNVIPKDGGVGGSLNQTTLLKGYGDL